MGRTQIWFSKKEECTMKRTAIPILVVLILMTQAVRIHASPFAAGDLVIYRVGDGVSSLVSTGNAVFLDEYTPAGNLVQSIAMPTTASGANNPLIASGTATSEGMLTL